MALAAAAALRSLPSIRSCVSSNAVFNFAIDSRSSAAQKPTARCASSDTSQVSTQEHPRVALVTGASRGLGLEFTRQLLQRPGQRYWNCSLALRLLHRVIAACRNPCESQQLNDLRSEYGKFLTTVKLDVTDEASIQAALENVQQQHQHLDMLLNVAGVLHVAGEFSPGDMYIKCFSDAISAETALSRVNQKSLQAVFEVNTFGPILMCKAFAPLLINASKVSGSSDHRFKASGLTGGKGIIPGLRERPAVVANLSARVGSISDNGLGGWYSYRASKTALNQLTKTMAIEFQRRRQLVSCVLLHPGTVDTDLSAPFQKNVKPEKLFTRERGVRQLLEIIDKTTMANTASFRAWDGSPVPW